MKRIYLFLAVITSIRLEAQENLNNQDEGLPTQDASWYASPWIWIIGAALFILLLLALTKGKKEA